MPAARNLTPRLVAWVTENPGHPGRDIAAQFGFKASSGMLTYLVKTERLFVAGPRSWHRYYATPELAAANHERLCAEVEANNKERRQHHNRLGNLRRRASRAKQGKRVLNVKTGSGRLGKGVALAEGVRITVAPTRHDTRYTRAPGEQVYGAGFAALGIGRYLDGQA